MGGSRRFNGEPGAQRVRDVLLDHGSAVAIHAVNLVEVLYCYRRKNPARAEQLVSQLFAAGMQIETSVGEQLRDLVVELKATRTPISLADAFAVAYAISQDAVLLTTDRGELEKLTDICKIEFLR